jgi:hypothetical protein
LTSPLPRLVVIGEEDRLKEKPALLTVPLAVGRRVGFSGNL